VIATTFRPQTRTSLVARREVREHHRFICPFLWRPGIIPRMSSGYPSWNGLTRASFAAVVVGMVSSLAVACGSTSTETPPDAANKLAADTSTVFQPDAIEVSRPDAIAPERDALDAPAVTASVDAVPAPVDGVAQVDLLPDLLPIDAGAGCSKASDCTSGFCVRGVCCDRACNGACEHCPSQADGKTGTCVPAPSGLLSEQCRGQDPATCGNTGACDGKGACAVYGKNTICRSASCEGGIFSPPSVCNGVGQCLAPTIVSCYPYACSPDGTGCASACSESAGRNCLGGQDAGATLDVGASKG
jgi:hypothetical protein